MSSEWFLHTDVTKLNLETNLWTTFVHTKLILILSTAFLVVCNYSNVNFANIKTSQAEKN